MQLSLIIVFCGTVLAYTTDNDWPDYKVQTTYWDAEDSSMVTEDSDKMFYQMEKIKDNKRDYELIRIMQKICLLKMMVKKIDKFLYKFFGRY